MPRCYGRYFGKLDECGNCALTKHCREAGDPPLLGDHPPNSQEYQDLGGTDLSARTVVPRYPEESEPGSELYTRGDLLEVIGFMMSLDATTLEFLAAKLGDPELSFSEMARRRGISRQGVHKYIRQRCEKNPELAAVLRNRIHRNYINAQKPFMEEVCKIRTKIRDRHSNRRKPDSICSKSLICSNRNFDLSKMSMLKGALIWNLD